MHVRPTNGFRAFAVQISIELNSAKLPDTLKLRIEMLSDLIQMCVLDEVFYLMIVYETQNDEKT